VFIIIIIIITGVLCLVLTPYFHDRLIASKANNSSLVRNFVREKKVQKPTKKTN
jgi:hypothetical protein